MLRGLTATTHWLSRGGALRLSASLVLAAAAAAPAQAAPPPQAATFSLMPVGTTSFLLRAKPGATLRRSVLVRNLSDHRVTVRLRPADIRSASNGNADYVTPRPSGTGRWLRLAARTIRLAPRAARRVAFSVRVPGDARGASHYAGIVAVDAADLATAADRRRAKTKSFSFQRINRQALPVTIRLPGPLTRRLSLRSIDIVVQPAGAGLVLGLLPLGSELIQQAPVRLRVLRGARTVIEHSSSLGQLFPGKRLDFRIPWSGTPARGSYRVVGVIRPHRARAIHIDQTIRFTPAAVAELQEVTTPIDTSAVASPTALPVWVWIALSGAAVLLLILLIALFKQRRRPAELVA